MRSRDTLDKPADDDLLRYFPSYLNYSLYNFEIKLPKREQQMLNACFEPVVIVFCCVIIRTTSNVCEAFVDTRPSPPRPRISDSGRLNSVV